MTVRASLVNGAIRSITGLLCDVDSAAIQSLPLTGPLIVVGNHLNWLDAPLILSRIQPRLAHTYAKIESFEKQPMRFLFETWNGIPVRRGEADVDALRDGLDALSRGRMLVILPEGTRSQDGRLLRGKPGVATLALRSGAPIFPVVWYGHECFSENVRRLRRTRVAVRAGNPFHIHTGGARIGRVERQQIADEIMYQIASLLPAPYRGYYSDLGLATEDFLSFGEGVRSNLLSADSDFADLSACRKARIMRRRGYGSTTL